MGARGRGEARTVSAGLNGSLNVADRLDGHPVLVVAVDVLVLQLTDLVDQDAELIRDIRNIVVTRLTPDGELLLCSVSTGREGATMRNNSQQLPCAHGRRAPCCASRSSPSSRAERASSRGLGHRHRRLDGGEHGLCRGHISTILPQTGSHDIATRSHCGERSRPALLLRLDKAATGDRSHAIASTATGNRASDVDRGAIARLTARWRQGEMPRGEPPAM